VLSSYRTLCTDKDLIVPPLLASVIAAGKSPRTLRPRPITLHPILGLIVSSLLASVFAAGKDPKRHSLDETSPLDPLRSIQTPNSGRSTSNLVVGRRKGHARAGDQESHNDAQCPSVSFLDLWLRFMMMWCSGFGSTLRNSFLASPTFLLQSTVP